MTVMDSEEPADPSPHEPRVTGAPETVWLVYGDLEHDDTHANCCASGEVTWCEDAQFPADVRYLRADLLYQQAHEIAAQALNTRERDCRTCKHWTPHHRADVMHCSSPLRCVAGSAHKRQGLVQLWESAPVDAGF